MKVMRLELFGRLDRYIGGLFLVSYATALLLIVGLTVIMDLASNLSYFEVWDDGTRVPTATLVRYYVLNVPFLFMQVAPFITVVAGLFTVARLLKKNELVAALSAGVSAHRLLAPVLLGGALAAGAMFALRESLTRVLGPRRDALHDLLDNHSYDRVFKSLWFRDRANNVVSLGEFWPQKQVIRGIDATVSEHGVWTRIHATGAVYAQKPDGAWGWRLENGVREEVDNEGQRPREIDWLEVIEFTPHDVLTAHKARERALELSFSEVIELAARDPSDTRYQTLLQYHLTFPLANLVLLLVALPFLVGRERGHGTEGLVVGCLMCVGYFCFDFVCRSLGMDGTLTPLMAAWLPTLVFGSLGAAMVHTMRS
jgi:lipopolysaccharide export LptBFGC system permease protein LptF